jgi:osmotically-inducible protein OsmY
MTFRTGAASEKMRLTADGKLGIADTAPAEMLDVTGNANVTGVYKVDDVQVVGNRVIDARIDDEVQSASWGSSEAGVLDAIRDAVIAHGLIVAA